MHNQIQDKPEHSKTPEEAATLKQSMQESMSKEPIILTPLIVQNIEENKAIKPLKNTLNIVLGSSIVAGFIIGAALKHSGHEFTKREILILSFPGEIFLRMLKGVTIPLVTSSIVASIGSIDISLAGKIAKRSLSFYMFTTVVATIFGITVVTTIKPGTSVVFNDTTKHKEPPQRISIMHVIMDIFRNIFPDNLILACLNTTQTKTTFYPELNFSNGTTRPSSTHVSVTSVEGTNILGILIFSIVTGIVVIGLPAKRKLPILDVIVALTEAMMFLTIMMMFYSPIGVAFLIIGAIIKADNLITLFKSVGMFTLSVAFGICLQVSIVYFGLYRCFVRKSFLTFLGAFSPALMTAFGTSSSAATIPASIQALIRAGLDRRIVEFMVPVGATVNMDGAALYEAMAVIFFAQARNREFTWGELVVVSVTATFASIGAAGIPSGGLIALLMMTTAMNIPAEDIALIAPVDWILDRLRTTTNVLGDAVGCAVVDSLLSKELKAVKKVSLPNIS